LEGKMPRLRKEPLLQKLWNQKILILMSVPFVVWLIIFRYLPLVGWVMAFQDITAANISIPYWQQPIVGLKNFIEIFSEPSFLPIVRNTLAHAILKLSVGTVASVVIAILIHETRKGLFKRTVQTISYLPYFISWVVAANLVLEMLSPEGPLNGVLLTLGIIKDPVLFMGRPDLAYFVVALSDVWKNAGFGAIIYLAAMTGIDPQLYEAADMDGAGRLRRIWHITLPGIKPTAVILLIMNVGSLLMNAGFDQQWLLRNGLNFEYMDVLSVFVLRWGLTFLRFSYAAAAGVMQSVVSLILVFLANRVARKLGEETLF
jgi:putative aldouronate transport system permease protein